MTFDEARAAIVGRLKTHMDANHAAVKVGYENRLLIDLSKQLDPFVTCEIVWNDGEQMSMETNPGARYRGAAWLAVHVKEGAGTKVTADLMTSLTRLFKAKSFGGVTSMVPVPVPARPVAGWHVQVIRVPVYFDDLGSV